MPATAVPGTEVNEISNVSPEFLVRKIVQCALVMVFVFSAPAPVFARWHLGQRWAERAERRASSAEPSDAGGNGNSEHEVPGWPMRPYLLRIPSGYRSGTPMPVVLLLHGAGPGGARAVVKLTCPDGNENNPRCLNGLADQASFVVVYPNGTKDPHSRVQTWNAGGGKNGYTCISGYACQQQVDDVEYIRAVLDDVERVVTVDRSRVYATGISNGAAMSHRLGCQLSNRIAAIAPVDDGNQFAAVESCQPSHPISVLQFHGTEDPMTPYNGGSKRTFGSKGMTVSIPESTAGWASRNGCQATPTRESLPDVANDDTTVDLQRYEGCRGGAEVVLYTIYGGGHTWPGGYQYMSARFVGRTTRDIDANQIIWEFFKRHVR